MSEAALQERLARIHEREERIRERKQALDLGELEPTARISSHDPNFPPFHPVIYHNIIEEVPSAYQTVVKFGLVLEFLVCLCLVVNLLACIATKDFVIGSGGYSFGVNVFWGLVYLLAIPYLSLRFVYIKLYENCRDGGVGIFWLVYESVYLMFTFYAMIGVKNSGLVGLISGIDGISCGKGLWTKLIAGLSAVLWAVFGVGECILVSGAYRLYKRSESDQSALPQ